MKNKRKKKKQNNKKKKKKVEGRRVKVVNSLRDDISKRPNFEFLK